MKFLCLPGAFGSAKNFQVQMGPFVAEAKKRGNVDFSWTQGTRRATPPQGFEDYFGAGVQWRFFDHDGMSSFDMLERIREFPEGTNAEDTMRVLIDDQPAYALASVQEAVQWLLDMIDADPEIEGVLGYSEGATVAATLILEERRRWEVEGRPRRIKRAIFFSGWPPLSMAGGKVQVLLADQCQDVIDIPTLHVVGYSDPYILGAISLFNMCNQDSAEMFDHGKGHTLPRDAETIKELGDAVDRLIASADSADSTSHGNSEEGWQVSKLVSMSIVS